MVVSSLIFMSSLPFEALSNQLSKWIFGDVMCRIVGSVYYLGFYSSVLFLTLLTFDRHLAVVYSLKAARVRNQRYAVISCAAIWLGVHQADDSLQTFKYMNKTLCQQFPLDDASLNMDMLRTSGFYIQLLLFLIFPLAVIIYCYVRIAISVISTKIITKFKTMFTSTPETQMETTTYYYEYDTLPNSDPMSLIDSLGSHLSILYYFMFLFSLFGNGLVLVIIYQFEKLTTVTNILLLNMVVSSLIFMSSLPFEALSNQLSKWIFGDVMCRIVGSVYYLGFYSSVLFLTLLTFDRHLAVVYSLKAARVRNQRYAVISCAAIWVISSLACIRPMILYKTFKYMNKTLCQQFPLDDAFLNMDRLRTSGFYIQLLLFLIFPLAVIIYCYVRIAISVISTKIITKFKTVRLIFFIVLFFFSCWTPYNIVWLMYDQTEGGTADIITRTIAYFYFCISPIFYTFVGKKFQNHFKQLLVKRFPGLKRHVSVSQHSRSNESTKSTQNKV
ncbi:hypothetical protein F7725_028743 [Dissostichus mawsoni]|uniref:G-protein coupled receptors family 1 profile domain-containing protein n=1 Tax=Dissostichus mawsoni TaxID=36200 RepID=A0A7J5XGI1_DISMA|nr:hypothetical protein F7725_028743 [Dissostichus mawsoni]